MKNQRGYGILSVVVAIAIGTILMLAISQTLTTTFRALAANQQGAQLEMIKQTLAHDIDCAATLASLDPNGSSCSSNSGSGGQDGAPVFLRLRRKTLDGSVKYLTPPLVGGVAKIGDWSIRATCSASEQSLVIRAARVQGTGFQKSFTGDIADWKSPKGLLFGGQSGQIPLCYAADPQNTPKRFATFRLRFEVHNNGTEYALVDLRSAKPTLVANAHAKISEASLTAPFYGTTPMIATVSVARADMRSPYYNVTATSPISYTFPSPGRIRVALDKSNDVGGGSAPFGLMYVTVLVFQ